jgi:hypothetical protein
MYFMRFIPTAKSLIRSVVVLIAVIMLTSVSIDATDSFRNSQSALSILARKFTTAGCAAGTVAMEVGDKTLCVDAYEASVGSDCTVQNPQSEIDTATNANDANCKPVSAGGHTPWRFVTVVQADQLCARAGTRLMTALEWYTAARGTPDNGASCGVSGNLESTGFFPLCKSGIGAFDMVGNVWELVSDSVVDGKVGSETLPSSGYVDEVTSDGLPQKTTAAPNVIYNKDYFWSDTPGTFAIMRGGYYGSGDDGGMYSSHADTPQNFSSTAVGFRCTYILPHA